MQTFKASAPPPPPEVFCHSPFIFNRVVEEEEEDDDDDDEHRTRNQARFSDLGELHHPPPAFHQQDDAVDLIPSSMFSLKSSNVAVLSSHSHTLQFPTPFNTSIGCGGEIATIGNGNGNGRGCLDTGQYMYTREITFGSPLGNGNINNIEKWGDSGMLEHSPQTDTSTDIDTDDKNQLQGIKRGALVVVDSLDQSTVKSGDQKTLRRLAQNREAARKSRLRKKAYVQQLESSRVKLAELEQELQRARQQGIFVGSGISGEHGPSCNGAVAFDMEHARWLDEHQRLISDLRSAMNSRMGDNELRVLVDGVMAHYDEIFRLKGIGTKSDVFHMLSGMWKTPAERCFMWLGGFRSSEILKIVGNQLEPLTDEQLMGICNLQQSSQQAEDALSQGMEALQQSLVDTLSSSSLGPSGSANVADYMGQMAIAMGKLGMLENFLHQADLLRQQTLQQMHRILTTRQAARALLVISDYTSRLRALSSLWLARPRD